MIRCAHCKQTHATVAEVRNCAALEASLQQQDTHFCESPSCAEQAGCAAYRYDSHANGYWGYGEEAKESFAWALEDELAGR